LRKKSIVGADRFKFERVLLKSGVTRIAGVDEAGRGPLAGPVVAAAVAFPSSWIQDGLPRRFRGLNDSKQLTLEEREFYFARLTSTPEVQYAIGIVDVETIDLINILQATHRAMNLALRQLQPEPEHTLVDGLRVNSLAFPQTPIVQGDGRSYSIAGASVIAKVYRDRMMLSFDRQFPGYGFAEHKGYCTRNTWPRWPSEAPALFIAGASRHCAPSNSICSRNATLFIRRFSEKTPRRNSIPRACSH
jgi:ribonuclease HII